MHALINTACQTIHQRKSMYAVTGSQPQTCTATPRQISGGNERLSERVLCMWPIQAANVCETLRKMLEDLTKFRALWEGFESFTAHELGAVRALLTTELLPAGQALFRRGDAAERHR